MENKHKKKYAQKLASQNKSIIEFGIYTKPYMRVIEENAYVIGYMKAIKVNAVPEMLKALIKLQKANRKMAQWIVQNDKSGKAFTGMSEDLQATNVIEKVNGN